MTKITQDMELKAGMKVMINEEILTIIEYGVTKSLGFIDSNHITTLCIRYTSGTKEQKLNELRDVLIENNAELIDDNAKVVVSEEVGKVLQKCEWGRKGKSFAIWLAELELALPVGYTIWTKQHNLTPSKIANIYENGWEVEKPKYWYRVVISKSGYAIVVEDINDGSTPQMAHENNGNHFYSREKAGEVAKRINDILKGGE